MRLEGRMRVEAGKIGAQRLNSTFLRDSGSGSLLLVAACLLGLSLASLLFSFLYSFY
jgi:hypothetical protein